MRRLLPLLFLALPAALAAQGPLTVGRPASGQISNADPKMEDNTFYDEWTFTAKARHRYRIVMVAGDFDAFLSLGQGSGREYRQLQVNDDGAGGTNSQIDFTATGDASYTIRANTVREGETGDYTLTLTDNGEVAPIRPLAITAAQAVSGTLDPRDPSGENGQPVDYYKFTARASHRYALTMLSRDFDALLEVGKGSNGGFTKERSDDDGAGNKNARLEWVNRDAGEVWVAARSFDSTSGRYSLFLEDLGDAPAPSAPTFLKPGAPIHAHLEGGAGTGDNGPYDLYYIDGQADQIVVIRMESDDFDPVLSIGTGDDADWHELDKDDDGGLGTNAHLEFKIPETGRFVVRAAAIGRNGGAYTISLSTE